MPSIRKDIVASEQIDREEFDPHDVVRGILHLIEWIKAGLAVRRAGLVHLVPLCNDSEVDY